MQGAARLGGGHEEGDLCGPIRRQWKGRASESQRGDPCFFFERPQGMGLGDRSDCLFTLLPILFSWDTQHF